MIKNYKKYFFAFCFLLFAFLKTNLVFADTDPKKLKDILYTGDSQDGYLDPSVYTELSSNIIRQIGSSNGSLYFLSSFYSSDDELTHYAIYKTDPYYYDNTVFKEKIEKVIDFGDVLPDDFFYENGNLAVLMNYSNDNPTTKILKYYKLYDSYDCAQVIVLNSGDSVSVARFINNDLYFFIKSSNYISLKKYNLDTRSILEIYRSDYYNSGFNYVLYNNGFVYFTADNFSYGSELWKTDGTTAGTVLVKDIVPGSGSSYPNSLVALNNELYFNAYDSSYGSELWKTDGTSVGTVLVKDINPGEFSSNLGNFIIFGNELYFNAQDFSYGYELWKTDGTTTGTVLVKDIVPGSGSSQPYNYIIFNNELYFTAYNSSNKEELWKTDGTSAGTVLIKEINLDSNNFLYAKTNNFLYFNAYDSSYGSELWKTDGTSIGTVLVKDIDPGESSSNPGNLIYSNGFLYFTANDSYNYYIYTISDFSDYAGFSFDYPSSYTWVYGEDVSNKKFSYYDFISLDQRYLLDNILFPNMYTYGLAGNSYNVILTDNLPGYRIYFANALPTVNKEAKRIDILAGNKTKVYGESDPALTYTITYGALISGDSITGSLSRSPGESVGTYAINKGTLTAGGNYNINYTAGVFTISEIIPIQLTISGTNVSKDKNYDGTNNSSILSIGTLSGVINNDTVNITATATYDNKNIGTNKEIVVSYSISGVDSWKYKKPDNLIINDGSILPVDITINSDLKTKVYGESDPALTYTITSGSLIDGDSITGSLSRSPGESVGTYAINKGTLTAGNNYNIIFNGSNFTILHKNISVSAIVSNKEYDGNSNANIVLNSDDILSGDSLIFGYASALFDNKNVGNNKTVTIDQISINAGVGYANYNLSSNSITAEGNISLRTIVISSENNKFYGESDPELTYTITSGSLIDGDSITGSLSRSSGESVGIYAINQGTLTAGNNYNIVFNSNNFIIKPITIMLDLDDNAKIYGESDPELTYTITSGSLIDGDSITGSLSRSSGENIGTYAINKGTLTAGNNYNIIFVPGTFTINNVSSSKIAPLISQEGNTIKATETVDSSDKEIIIPSSVTEVSLTFGYGTTNNTVNMEQFVTENLTNKTGTLPEMTLTTPTIVVEIPNGTEITAPTGWNEIIKAPEIKDNTTVTTSTVPTFAESGYDRRATAVIDIGSTGSDLIFSKGIRVFIPGQADKNVGFIKADNTFYEITDPCSADSQATGDSLDDGKDCKINVGSDLVVWTKHFTQFVAFTRDLISSSTSNHYFGTAYCSGFVYSDWGECINGFQNRNIISWMGGDTCDKGLAILRQSCILEKENPSPIIIENNNIPKPIDLILENREDLTLYDPLESRLSLLNKKRDIKIENIVIKDYAKKYINIREYGEDAYNRIVEFIVYGTIGNKYLNYKDRIDIVNKFKKEFKKMPADESDWILTIGETNVKNDAQIKLKEEKAIKLKKEKISGPSKLKSYKNLEDIGGNIWGNKK